MVQTIKLLMNLVRHRLRPELGAGELPESIASETAKKLMGLAQMHSLTAIVGSELMDQNLLPPGDLCKEIQQDVFKAVFRCNNLVYQQQWLSQILEEAEIPFMPLKGSVIRCYYPEPWLRTSCDIDILIHREDLARAASVLQKKGCTKHCDEGFHDISLFTPSGVLLELHFSIQENIAVMDAVLDRVWNYGNPVPGKKFEYCQDNSFLMFHLIAHMAYHCKSGGCGIRSLVDIWLLQAKMDYDSATLYQLLDDAKLTKFYETALRLNDVWFHGKPHTLVTNQLENIILTGGSYGSWDNKTLIDQAQAGSKEKRLLKRIFMPYNDLKTQYPILEKHRWLMPFFQIVRWFRIFSGGRLKHAIREYNISQKHSNTQIDDTKRFLEEVGLDFSIKSKIE